MRTRPHPPTLPRTTQGHGGTSRRGHCCCVWAGGAQAHPEGEQPPWGPSRASEQLSRAVGKAQVCGLHGQYPGVPSLADLQGLEGSWAAS